MYFGMKNNLKNNCNHTPKHSQTDPKLYSRNLKFLVPFFDCPSIGLQNIEKVNNLYKLKIYFTVNKSSIFSKSFNFISGHSSLIY
jgi:hypothetical protein